jgi:hypothetical protein
MSNKKFFKDVDPAWVGVIHFVAYLYGVWAAGSLIESMVHQDGGGIVYWFAIPVWLVSVLASIVILHILFNFLTSDTHRLALVAAALTAVLVGYGFPGIVHLIIAASLAVYAYRTESQEVREKEDLRNFK